MGIRIFHCKSPRAYPEFPCESRAYWLITNPYEVLKTLYWTRRTAPRKVQFIMKNTLPLLLALLSLTVHAAPVQAVSADEAQRALSQGAFVVDVRDAAHIAQGHLAGTAGLPRDIAQRPLAELSERLSRAGVDSSRTVLVVGQAGDENAQALAQLLSRVSSGRVLWLVGGVSEWQMRGYALVTESAPRAAVPQVLTYFSAQPSEPRMAGHRVRSGALLERDIGIKLAASSH